MEKDFQTLYRMCEGIPIRASFRKIEPIVKGVSGDAKYAVETEDGQRYLLRVSDGSERERKEAMFGMMKRVDALGVAMCRPVDFGLCNHGKNVYQLLTWCEGETADAVLPALSVAQRYAIGIQAGQNLRRIHSIPAPEDTVDWYERFISVDEKRLRAFPRCGVPIAGSESIFAYYEENHHLLRGRPQCLLHGDFHNENILVTPNLAIAIVDWDLLDSLYGDPWSEFNRLSMCQNFSPHFATGLLRGYFGGDPPEEFWLVLALYLSVGALTLVSWAATFEPTCLEECQQGAATVLSWFEGMRSPVPTWYLRDFAPVSP
jgi:serine/threonine-protein kinase